MSKIGTTFEDRVAELVATCKQKDEAERKRDQEFIAAWDNATQRRIAETLTEAVRGVRRAWHVTVGRTHQHGSERLEVQLVSDEANRTYSLSFRPDVGARKVVVAVSSNLAERFPAKTLDTENVTVNLVQHMVIQFTEAMFAHLTENRKRPEL